MTHDVCGPGTIGVFHQHFGKDAKVWDRRKVVVIPDHYIFTSDKMANRNVDVLRQFAAEQDLPYFYDVGSDKYKGVCHIALPEEGHTRPGLGSPPREPPYLRRRGSWRLGRLASGWLTNADRRRGQSPSSCDCFGLGFRAPFFDGYLHGIFHRVFEGYLDAEQAVVVGRFGFVRFHRPT
jgi:hypothetical protein